MGKLSELGSWIGERARAAAEDAEAAQAAKVTTRDSRSGRATWGAALLQLSGLLSTIGASLLTGAYEDAESTAAQEHDRGYEQRRHDEAEAAGLRVEPAYVDEDQAAAADPAAVWAAAEKEWQDEHPGVGVPFVPTIEGGAEPGEGS
jgi:hypothetical protein